MTLIAGKMYRPTDVVSNTNNNTVYVVEQFNHRISKWIYVPTLYDFIIDAGQVIDILITNGGTGYSVGDPIIVAPPDLNIADPITAIAQVGGEVGGVITSVIVFNIGNGYSVAPTVDATGSGNGDAVLTTTSTVPWGNNGEGTTGQGAPIGDGGPTDNSLYRPTGIIFENSRLTVTDTFHNRIRTINATTGAFIDSVGQGGSSNTDFYHPRGITLAAGTTDIYIADELNHRALRYTAGDTPTFDAVLTSPTPKSFNRPRGIVHDNTVINVTDTYWNVLSQYSVNTFVFVTQFGSPGTTGSGLFFSSGGHGVLLDAQAPFADTRNNVLKRLNGININNLNVSEGTGNGQLYYPESVASFEDTFGYALVANTRNNRIEVYSNIGPALNFESNFGAP